MAKGFSHLPTHHLPVSDAEGDASYSWGLWQPYGETSSALTLSPEGQASLPWILEASMTALTYKRGWKWLSESHKAGRKWLVYQNTRSWGSDPPGQKPDDPRATGWEEAPATWRGHACRCSGREPTRPAFVSSQPRHQTCEGRTSSTVQDPLRYSGLPRWDLRHHGAEISQLCVPYLNFCPVASTCIIISFCFYKPRPWGVC